MEKIKHSGEKSEETVSSSGAVKADDFIKLFKTDGQKLSFQEAQTAKNMAKELRRWGMLTGGKKGFDEETYNTVIKRLKDM